jgi:hypothetical protein
MRWKFKVDDDDFERWEAQASPLVGRRYQVYSEWRPDDFRVAYLDHNYDWHCLEGAWPTPAEAKAAAEVDNAQRRAIALEARKARVRVPDPVSRP